MPQEGRTNSDFGYYPRWVVPLTASVMCSPTQALGLRTEKRLSMPTAQICISPRVTEPNPENLSLLVDCQGKSAGRPTSACCALRCLSPKATLALYGKLSPTGPICIPCFRVGVLLPQNVRVPGRPTGSTSFSALRTGARPALQVMSGQFGKSQASSGGRDHNRP